jgi:hypothetical protein
MNACFCLANSGICKAKTFLLFNFQIKDDIKAAREHPQAGTRTEAYILVRRGADDEADDDSALFWKLN